MRMVTLTHPDLDSTIEVPESSVRIHERSGWCRKAPAKAKAEKANAVKKASRRPPIPPPPTNGPLAGEES